MCCCWNMSECLLSSLWSCSGRTPTFVNKLRKTFSSSINNSILFCSLSFSLTNNLTFSSVSRDLNFAFSLLFLTAMLFLSRRLLYSSLALSTDLWFFLLLLLLLLWWWFSIAVLAAKFFIPETNNLTNECSSSSDEIESIIRKRKILLYNSCGKQGSEKVL